ncbi:hypothetical protein D6D17_06293 [Aureobasidium pullulans]|nr:hypothetical protein D6D17_06293 [Aureobasidium pullulans]
METPQRSSRHRKKDSDLLAEVPDHAVQFDLERPSTKGSDSLLSQIVLGPLTMISFLFSLCVVDSRQRAWRISQHQHDSGPWWKKLSPWTWWNAEPYQSPQDSTWQHAVPATTTLDGADGTVPASAVNTDHWHTRKKHRKMARLTLSDAIDMREGMAIMLVTAALLGLVVMLWLARRIFSSIV